MSKATLGKADTLIIDQQPCSNTRFVFGVIEITDDFGVAPQGRLSYIIRFRAEGCDQIRDRHGPVLVPVLLSD